MNVNWFAPTTIAIIGAVLLLIGMGVILKVRRKDAFKTAGWITLAIGIIGMFLVPVSDVRDLMPSSDALTVGESATTTVVSGSGCSDTKTSTLYTKITDDTSSSATYLSANSYLTDSSGYFVAGVLTTGAGAYTSQSATLSCPNTYKYNVITSQDNVSSAIASMSIDQPTEYLDVKTHQISKMQIRMEDNTAPASSRASYIYTDGTAGYLTNTTSFINLNDSFAYNTTNVYQGDWVVGTDGELDLTIYVKATTSNKFAGDQDMWAVVDLGTASDWQQPSVSFNGVGLSDAKVSLISQYPDSSTGTLISASEYAYKLGDGKTIGDTIKALQFRVKARSGVNPSTSDDIKICFMSAGSYASSKVANTLKNGIYTDASTQALVTTALTPCVTIPTA